MRIYEILYWIWNAMFGITHGWDVFFYRIVSGRLLLQGILSIDSGGPSLLYGISIENTEGL